MWDGENFKFLNFGTDFDTFGDGERQRDVATVALC